MYEYWRIYGFKVGLLGLYYYELLQYAISSVLAMKVIRSRYACPHDSERGRWPNKARQKKRLYPFSLTTTRV